ncbi:hypothetical protein HZS_7129 [Henneguya salminicola]|nr:hypothetical protein HZS_7129 [Henneguya salminicola]
MVNLTKSCCGQLMSLSLLRYNIHTFMDGTFICNPASYAQYMIPVAYDKGAYLYISCVYSLVTGKHEYIYCTIPNEVLVLLEYNWMPKWSLSM